jgi:hypothetical protein
LYGRRDVAPPPPLPLCRGLATCAREERAKPIGDRRAGRWSPCGAGAEAGRGLWPRGFSVGPERETSESEARVAARLMTEPWEARKWLEDASPETMRRDGRSFSAGFSANRSRKHISRDRRNNRQRVSVPRPKQWAESLRRERFNRSPAGRGQKGRAAFPWTGAGNVGIGGKSCGAFNAPRRAFVQRGVSRKPERETYLPRPTK